MEDSKQDEPHNEKTLHRYRIITTMFFFYAWFNMGVTHCVLGSTLPDFRRRIGITNEEFGRMGMVVTVFVILGGLVCGVFVDRFQKYVLLVAAMTQFTMAVGHVMIPWSVNIYMAGCLYAIRDMAFISCNALGSAYVVAMWGKKASLWIHLLHAGYPAGCVFGPIIARPFLSINGPCANIEDTLLNNLTSDARFETGQTQSNLMFNYSTDSSSEQCIVVADTIEWPYAIGAASWIISAILFLLLHFNVIKRPEGFRLSRKPTQRLRDSCNPNTCAPGRPGFGVLMIGIFFLYYSCLACVAGIITNTFLFTYAVDGPFQFTNQRAAYLDTALKASMLLGRFVILPLTHFIPIQKLLPIELLLVLICSILLATLGTSQAVFLWIFSCLFNFLLAPLWPGALSWFDRYVSLYTVIIVTSDIFIQSFVAIVMWVVGAILDSDHKEYMWFLNSTFVCILFIAVLIGQSIACGCGYGERKFENTSTHAEDNDIGIALRDNVRNGTQLRAETTDETVQLRD